MPRVRRSPATPSATKREVICDHCGGRQFEAPAAIQTICRQCGESIRLERIVLPRRRVRTLWNELREWAPPAITESITEHARRVVESARAILRRPAPASRRPGVSAPAAPPTTRPPSRSSRNVACFECPRTHRVAASATSSLCPGCGAYIDLREVEIREPTRQRIRTRGHVIIHRRGSLTSPGIHCGDLTVLGRISGSIIASGTVDFRASARILGEVRCGQLIVRRRVRVDLLQRAQMDTALIDGAVTGDICCRRTLQVGREGSIDGAVLAGRLRLDAGGRINGPTGILSRATLAHIIDNPDFSGLTDAFDVGSSL